MREETRQRPREPYRRLCYSSGAKPFRVSFIGASTKHLSYECLQRVAKLVNRAAPGDITSSARAHSTFMGTVRRWDPRVRLLTFASRRRRRQFHSDNAQTIRKPATSLESMGQCLQGRQPSLTRLYDRVAQKKFGEGPRALRWANSDSFTRAPAPFRRRRIL